MKTITHLSTVAGMIWAILHFGLPDHPTRATYEGTYNVEFAALALLAIAASLYAALKRKP